MSEESSLRQLVVFSLGDEEYALPITQVHEIIRYSEPRSVASPDESVRGVISLRGRILPVYDLATRLGIVHGPLGDSAKIVIVETSEDTAGVVVDDVQEVMSIAVDQLDETPTVGGACIDGIVRIGDRLVVLLDPQAIVAKSVERPADVVAPEIAAPVAVAVAPAPAAPAPAPAVDVVAEPVTPAPARRSRAKAGTAKAA